jgi:hypothetical protein
MALCGNTGGNLAVVDVDPRNGGDIEAVRKLLDELGVRVFADVITPSGGRHFYVASCLDLPTAHSIPDLPGVDLQSSGANVYLPGTLRPKYDGAGYTIVLNDLEALLAESLRAYAPDAPPGADVGGSKALGAWVAEHAPKSGVTGQPGDPWNGTPPDARQQAYLNKALTEETKSVAEATQGGRNTALNKAAFTLGTFVAGAGLDQQRVEDALQEAAIECGLADDDGMDTVEATIFSGLTSGMENPRAVPDPPEAEQLPAEWRRHGLRKPKADNVSQADKDRTAQAEAAFWEQRDILAHILRFSRSRGAAPYAVLGGVLRRAITLVEPIVQLPPTVGDNASVNLFTVSVGRSGQGKGIANGVGRRAVQFVTPDGEVLDDPPSPGIGSGEGLARVFKGYGSGDEGPPTRVHVEVPEVGTLGALADRSGSTLVGELLKAYMGEAIGFSNAQRVTTTFIPAHSYRLCLSIGAQPENADFFLKREKDGLPQRFVWLPTIDPYAPAPSREPEEPVEAARVVIPGFSTIIEGGPYLIGSEDVDPLDKHLMLVRLKVAFGLALLDGRRDITEDDWRIAGQLIDVSNRVRSEMRAVITERHRSANTARAHDQADREAIITDRLSERTQQRVKRAISNKLQLVGQASRRVLKKNCDKKIRGEFDTVFDLLVDTGFLVCCETGDGRADTFKLA